MDNEQSRRVRENVKKSHSASQSSRYGKSGVTRRSAKMNGKNYTKLMESRGVSKQGINDGLNSFARMNRGNYEKFKSGKGVPQHVRDQKKDNLAHGRPMTTRHARKGEMVTVASGKGQQASGIYASNFSRNNNRMSSRTYQRKYATPLSNTAENRKTARLGRDQNVVQGKVAPQRGKTFQAPGGVQKSGGGRQTVTDGGFRTGAVRDMPSLKKPGTAGRSQGARYHRSPNQEGMPKRMSVADRSKAGRGAAKTPQTNQRSGTSQKQNTQAGVRSGSASQGRTSGSRSRQALTSGQRAGGQKNTSGGRSRQALAGGQKNTSGSKSRQALVSGKKSNAQTRGRGSSKVALSGGGKSRATSKVGGISKGGASRGGASKGGASMGGSSHGSGGMSR